MPIIKSAKKALRAGHRREVINLKVKKKVKTAVKAARLTPSKKTLSDAFRWLDRAGKSHLYHKNKVSRLKSRLNKLTLKAPKAPLNGAKMDKKSKKSSSKKTR